MATLLSSLVLVLIGGHFSARIATRLQLPNLFGELAPGLALGPFIIRWMGDTSSTDRSPYRFAARHPHGQRVFSALVLMSYAKGR